MNAKRLRTIREFLGYSQRELARDFQVTNGAIAHWESGDRPIPGPILKIMGIYEQSLRLNADQENLISEEALRASRDLFKKTVQILKQEGVSFHETTQHKIDAFIRSFLRESFAKDPIGGRIKIAVIKQILKSFKGSRGLSIKAAQLASFLEWGLPPEIPILLDDLQHMAKGLTYTQIQKIVRDAYGRPPDHVFSKFQSQPLAVTSLAQLHKATLITGEEVVVKIQHPQIRETLKGQFRNLSLIVFLSKILGPSLDEAFTEIQRLVFLELDYEHEAKQQELFRKIFEHEPRIVVPKIHVELCKKNIIVSQFEPGIPFSAFSVRAAANEKSQAALLIAYFHGFAIFRHGLMHVDAHPSNFLFRKDQVVFLDFGRVAHYEPAEIEPERALYMALLNHDKERFLDLLFKRGQIPSSGAFDHEKFWWLTQKQEAHHLTDGRFKITKDHIKSVNFESQSFRHRSKIRIDRYLLRSLWINVSLWNLFASLEAEAPWRAQALDILNPECRLPRFKPFV